MTTIAMHRAAFEIKGRATLLIMLGEQHAETLKHLLLKTTSQQTAFYYFARAYENSDATRKCSGVHEFIETIHLGEPITMPDVGVNGSIVIPTSAILSISLEHYQRIRREAKNRRGEEETPFPAFMQVEGDKL